MVPLPALWLPIVLSAVAVFLLSFVIHMVLPVHRGDLNKIPNEDAVLDFLRAANLPAGDYAAPHVGSPAGMKDPAFIERVRRGPLLLMNIAPGSGVSMGKQLTQWFIYVLIVSLFAGYIAGRAHGPGSGDANVFRFASTTAWLAYAMALPQFSIWWRRSWSTTLKTMFIDALVYALATGAVFCLLWPSA
jgi:hypothetical protein